MIDKSPTKLQKSRIFDDDQQNQLRSNTIALKRAMTLRKPELTVALKQKYVL